MWNPKHSAKYVCRTGTSASSTARAVTSCDDDTKENKKYIKSVLDLFSIPNLLHQERATPRAPLREEARGSRVLHREFAQEEMQEEKISWVFTTGSSVMKDSART